MKLKEALSWLENHQPLPNDKELTQEIADTYDLIRKYFMHRSDKKCIPLFLNSFGDRDGWGMYQLIEDALCLFSAQDVLPYLQESLQSHNPYVRQWSAYIASDFPSSSLISPLCKLLADEDYDVKAAAIIALK